MDQEIKLSPDTILLYPHGEYALIDVTRKDAYYLNEHGEVVVKMLMAGFSLKEICHKILNDLRIDSLEEVKNKTAQFINKLNNLKTPKGLYSIPKSKHLCLFNVKNNMLIELNRDAEKIIILLLGKRDVYKEVMKHCVSNNNKIIKSIDIFIENLIQLKFIGEYRNER